MDSTNGGAPGRYASPSAGRREVSRPVPTHRYILTTRRDRENVWEAFGVRLCFSGKGNVPAEVYRLDGHLFEREGRGEWSHMSPEEAASLIRRNNGLFRDAGVRESPGWSRATLEEQGFTEEEIDRYTTQGTTKTHRLKTRAGRDGKPEAFCEVCGRSEDTMLNYGKCPGITWYVWQFEVPETLATRSKLDKLGLKPGAGGVAAAVLWSWRNVLCSDEGKERRLPLYPVAEAVPLPTEVIERRRMRAALKAISGLPGRVTP